MRDRSNRRWASGPKGVTWKWLPAASGSSSGNPQRLAGAVRAPETSLCGLGTPAFGVQDTGHRQVVLSGPGSGARGRPTEWAVGMTAASRTADRGDSGLRRHPFSRHDHNLPAHLQGECPKVIERVVNLRVGQVAKLDVTRRWIGEVGLPDWQFAGGGGLAPGDLGNGAFGGGKVEAGGAVGCSVPSGAPCGRPGAALLARPAIPHCHPWLAQTTFRPRDHPFAVRHSARRVAARLRRAQGHGRRGTEAHPHGREPAGSCARPGRRRTHAARPGRGQRAAWLPASGRGQATGPRAACCAARRHRHRDRAAAGPRGLAVSRRGLTPAPPPPPRPRAP